MKKQYLVIALLCGTIFNANIAQADDLSFDDLDMITAEDVSNVKTEVSWSDYLNALATLPSIAKDQIDTTIENYPKSSLTASSLLMLYGITGSKLAALLSIGLFGYPLYKSGTIVYEECTAPEKSEA